MAVMALAGIQDSEGNEGAPTAALLQASGAATPSISPVPKRPVLGSRFSKV